MKLKTKIIDNFHPDKGYNFEKILDKKVKERSADFGQKDSKKEMIIRKDLEDVQFQKIAQELIPMLIDEAKNISKRDDFKKFESDKDFFYNLSMIS